jgi:cation transport protein ChaC
MATSTEASAAEWDAENGVWVGERAIGVSEEDLPDPLYVFGYGSLCWRIDDPYEEIFDAKVMGWRRRFAQGSYDHRGTAEYAGVVATLMPEEEWLAAGLVVEDGDQPVTNGVVYRVPKSDAKRVIDNLDFREKGGYTKAIVDATSLDGSRTVRALIYTANSRNPLFMGGSDSLGTTAPKAIAERIHKAVGPSGPNIE